MGQRLIISEEEKRRISEMNNLISEDMDSMESNDEFYLKQYGDNWYDVDDYMVDGDFDDFDEELEFGPDDYESFLDAVKGAKSTPRWNPMMKQYFDRFTRMGPESGMNPLKLRVKRGGYSDDTRPMLKKHRR